MQITNKYNLPIPLVRAVTNSEYNAGKSDITVSRLIDSPRINVLTKKHTASIEIDAMELVLSSMGTALHSLWEKHSDEKEISEERLFTKINGWTVSGQIDAQIVEPDGVVVRDYKTTSAWAVMHDKRDWELQLNLYGWLVERVKGIKVKRLEIIAYIRDWARRDVGKDGYPETPIVILEKPLWSMEDREKYLLERLNVHAEADASITLGGDLPKCSAEEQWRKPETFAVMRNKNPDRAWRVFPTKEEAENFASQQKDVTVVTRKAEATRCQSFCKVAPFCDQYKEENEIL